MPDIAVNTYSLKQYAQRIGSVNARITNLDWRLKSLYFQVGLVDLFNLIQADLLMGYSHRLSACKTYLDQTANDFENTESRLLQFDPLHFSRPNPLSVWLEFLRTQGNLWSSHLKNIQALFRNGAGAGLINCGIAGSALPLMSGSAWDAFWGGDLEYSKEGHVYEKKSDDGESYFRFLTGERSGSLGPEYGEYKNKKLKRVVKQEKKDKKSNLPDEKWYEKNGTILEAEAEGKIEGSVLGGRLAGDNDWAEGAIEGKLLTGEAHMNLAGGLYVYEADKNGEIKRIFSPGVSAEVGVSASVLEFGADGRIGLGENKNMLGMYGQGELKVLTGEAKAKAAINRKEVYLGASAEADWVKAGGSLGVSVLGTDIGANASLKVGVGAHAEIGYTDGKFKVDVGAALGVGFDLGFELDVGGTVDAVFDFASSAWDGAKDIASGALRYLFG